MPTDGTFKLSVEGSNYSFFENGSQVGSTFSDPSISGGLRCGLWMNDHIGNDAKGNMDDFEAADLAAAGIPAHAHYYAQRRAA